MFTEEQEKKSSNFIFAVDDAERYIMKMSSAFSELIEVLPQFKKLEDDMHNIFVAVHKFSDDSYELYWDIEDEYEMDSETEDAD